MKEVLILDSVGNCIDKKGFLYPVKCDGTFDFEMSCHIDDTDDEFWEHISDDDSQAIVSWLS